MVYCSSEELRLLLPIYLISRRVPKEGIAKLSKKVDYEKKMKGKKEVFP